MNREPLFMRDLHKRQGEEYKRTQKLTLRQFIEYINSLAGKSGYLKGNVQAVRTGAK